MEKNSDLELVGGRDNRYNNERNKRAFHSAAVSNVVVKLFCNICG